MRDVVRRRPVARSECAPFHAVDRAVLERVFHRRQKCEGKRGTVSIRGPDGSVFIALFAGSVRRSPGRLGSLRLSLTVLLLSAGQFRAGLPFSGLCLSGKEGLPGRVKAALPGLRHRLLSRQPDVLPSILRTAVVLSHRVHLSLRSASQADMVRLKKPEKTAAFFCSVRLAALFGLRGALF